ncbi:MAG: GreA/GreB family elongation factor [Chlamydiae bacterium]|nr:GreA/GreB family elongation factor [Chlamydiota bacterium]
MTTFQLEKGINVEMGYFEDFNAVLIQQDPPSLVKLWEEYTRCEEIDAKDLKLILQAIKTSPHSDYIGRHVERILPLWEKLQDSPEKEEALKFIIDLQMTGSDLLRQLAYRFLESKFKDSPHHNEKMRLVGLRGKHEEFKGAISNYELLSHLKSKKFVFHTSGWGVGEIIEISYIREQASFEFDYVPGKKDISFKNCFSSLIPIPETHFLALRFGNPDELEAMAKKDPVNVIYLLLKDLGPKTAAEIKDELCELTIPTQEWTKWWQSVRTKIKKDQRILVPEDLSKPFELSSKEISHEERLQKVFDKKPDANTLIQMVYSFLKDFPDAIKNANFKSILNTKLQEVISFPELTEAQKIQIFFFLKELNGEKAFSPMIELLKASSDLKKLIQEITVQAFKKRTLIEIRKEREDWIAIFLDLLLMIDSSSLKDYLLEELLTLKTQKELKNKIQELCAYPFRYPDAFIWYFQKILNETVPFEEKEEKNRFFESLLILLSHLEQAAEQRDLIKKIHTILSSGRFASVRKIMKDASIKDVQEFLLLASKCRSLSDHDLKIFHSLAEVVHPSLAKKKTKAAVEEEEEIIWTTQEGYQNLQKRIEQIATVETIENAKEIEVARGHGDLRENAEFKSALEKRDRLQAELKFLSDQLNKSRIITKPEIHTDRVGIGTIVDCRKKNGEQVSYTLLGPWDADPEKNILSFQSKLAKTMANLKVGDKFQFQGEQLQITQIRSAL